MRKSTILITLLTLISTQTLLADTTTTVTTPSATSSSASDLSSKQCEGIAKACKSAGYTREGASSGKQFWADCMKPILLGQTVAGVSITADDATACRQQKVENMKKELEQLQQVVAPSSTQSNG